MIDPPDFTYFRTRVEAALNHVLTISHPDPTHLFEAMRYATLQGGKRLRAICVYMAGIAAQVELPTLDRIAAAVECLHAYSLIHDDLPCMDDAELRRGKPSCHRAFDEATAVLAGDALQALAFDLLAHLDTVLPTQRIAMLQLFSRAVGTDGMVGGQALDLWAEGQSLPLMTLEHLHTAKTGALIEVSLCLGALANPQYSVARLSPLASFGRKLGLAFQMKDDLLDVQGNVLTLGKLPGQDQVNAKCTYVHLLGIEGTIEKMHQCMDSALQDLIPLGDSFAALRTLCTYVVNRDC